MPETIVEDIFNVINRFGQYRYGEDINQLQHCLQCAELARLEGEPDSMIAASLLHDIGQFLDDAGDAAEKKGIDARHEVSGAAHLWPWFPDEVIEPIRLHVAAKRYLCAVENGYFDSLSAASVLSLRLQGGPMNPQECEDFRREPYFAEAIRLRHYDDKGKRRDWDVPALESYRPLLESLIVPR